MAACPAMSNQTVPMSRLVANPNNPRKVTPSKLNMLQKSLEQFGDLSGIIFNESSKQLVGGHQRTEVAHVLGTSDVVIERTYNPPTDKGTTAEGYILLNGERHAYRQVRWTKNKEKAANLAANNSVGQWDNQMVAQWLEDLKGAHFDMDLTLFNDRELEMFSYDLPQEAAPVFAPTVRTADAAYVPPAQDENGQAFDPQNGIPAAPQEPGAPVRNLDRNLEVSMESLGSFAATCPRCSFAFNPDA